LKVAVKIFTGEVKSREVELPDGSAYYDLLDLLKINPETVVVFKEGVPVAFDAPVDMTPLEIMRVVSGG
jgi:sulfur carrier protein